MKCQSSNNMCRGRHAKVKEVMPMGRGGAIPDKSDNCLKNILKIGSFFSIFNRKSRSVLSVYINKKK